MGTENLPRRRVYIENETAYSKNDFSIAIKIIACQKHSYCASKKLINSNILWKQRT